MFRKKILASLALAFLALSSYASPLWMRDAKISPDGKYIAFQYKGDIYKVKSTGGTAIQLTTQSSYEATPIWSPDGKKIAFTSDRHGNFDIFLMSADGGPAKRLTTNSTKEIPSTFTPDGKFVLFSALMQDPSSSVLFPSGALTELYKVSVKAERPIQVLGTPAEMVTFNKKGDRFIYQDRKGFENEWRKHHTSSVTRDIWMYDLKTKKHTRLVDWKGEDRNPVFTSDDKTVYYLSEKFGTFNVCSFNVNAPKNIKKVTSFKVNPVRFLSISKDNTLCFTYDGEIYTKAQNKRAKKVNINIVRDDENVVTRINNRGASSAVASKDGKQIAFIARGEVFVTSADYSTTKQITHTPQKEQGLTFAPDGRTIAYATERNGFWQLCTAKIERKEDLNFATATSIKEKVLLPSKKVERAYPQFSPDGKEIAFVEGRSKLMVMNLKSKKVRQITDGSKQYNRDGDINFSWSPDGKWFTLSYVGNGRDPYYDVGVVSSKGGKITNLTNSGYFDADPKWVMDGNAILFISNRYGMRSHASWGSLYDAMIVFLNQDSYDKFVLSKEDYELQKQLEKQQKADKAKAEKNSKKGKKKGKKASKKPAKKEIELDFNNLEDRMLRLTPNSANMAGAIINKAGTKLYYLAAFEGRYDLWSVDLRARSTRLLNKMNTSWASMSFDESGKNLFLLGSSFKKMNTMSNRISPISYSAVMQLDKAAEREYMFNHVYLQEKEKFYNLNMHGVNWDKMTETYRKFLPHINNNYDFSEMLSELLGELNVSHTGSGYKSYLGGDATAKLGFLYDLSYDKKGLKIAEVIERGPFDHHRTAVKAGDIVEKIDGVTIEKNMDYFPLLNHKAGKRVLISFYRPSTKKHWTEVTKPTSPGVINALLYKRWIKQTAKRVDELSGGRLGYVHIKSMDDDSFRKIYSDILGKYNNREGIVIDTRFNGGGRLHEDIEVLFSGKKYFNQVIRGKVAGEMPSRRWNKPSIMLQCEANYSNAHGTPWVYKHVGIGKLVGMPVPGTMTSVNWETLQDPTVYFGIPVTGYRLPDGTYLENKQLEPDIKIANKAETVVKGEDLQLKAAVKELLKELDAKK